MSNLFLTMELGISYHMKQNQEVHTQVHCIHCKCTDMKLEKWTSIADGYVSCNVVQHASATVENWNYL